MNDKLKTIYKDMEYPLNLLFRITEDENFIANTDTITDLNGTVEYVLCTLSQREREILQYRFKDKLTFDDIAKIYNVTRERIRQIEAKTLRKLRHPNRLKYIKYGVLGVINRIREERYNKYKQLERQLIELCKVNEMKADKIIKENELKKKYENDKIEMANFSVRTYNALKRACINTISELSQLSYNDICNIRNLSQRSVNEIIDKLKSYGYEVNHTLTGEEGE